MKLGDVVDFETPAGPRLGAVVGVVGADKLVILADTGEQRRAARKEVTGVVPTAFDPADPNAPAEALQALAAQLESVEAELDLSELWRRSLGLEPMDARSLAFLWRGAHDPLSEIAVSRALAIDDVYFRHRKGHWEARPSEQVEAQHRNHARSIERDATRADFVTATASMLAGPAAERAHRFDTATADPAFRHWADLLRGFAASEDEFPRRREAIELLGDLERASGMNFASDGGPRGLQLMVALGLWSEHEVLAPHRLGLRLEHDEEMVAEAERRARQPFVREAREDFTGWWSITIDDADTKDIDDALSVRPSIDGGWELAVHIADPDAFIEIDTTLDAYIRARGTSIYLPTGVHSMIPAPLSERAMSLLPDGDRPGITTVVTFDPDLQIVEWRIAESIVRVNRRLSYADADRMIDDDGIREHAATVVRDLAFLADELHARRLDRGAVTIELPEARLKVAVDQPEPTIQLDLVSRSASRNMVAEFMVLVGELTARWCRDRHIPIAYRTQPVGDDHDDPDPDDTPEGWARAFAVLRRMARGTVSTTPAPHAGLGLEIYAQVTSPIRRFGDLAVLRQVKAALRDKPLPYSAEDMMAVTEVIERARHGAATIEDEARNYWMLRLLQRHEGEEVNAVVLARDHGAMADVLLTDFGHRAKARVQRARVSQATTLTVERVRPRAAVLVLRET